MCVQQTTQARGALDLRPCATEPISHKSDAPAVARGALAGGFFLARQLPGYLMDTAFDDLESTIRCSIPKLKRQNDKL